MDAELLGAQWLPPHLMDPSPGPRSKCPPRGPLDDQRLQPAPELRIVSQEELLPFEDRREAEHLARLEADQELINALQWAGFEGEGWKELAMALAEYGVAVMTAWLSTGAIVRKCREKNLRGLRSLPDTGLAPDAVDELATLVVGDALESFRQNVLKTHKWDARKGSSLKTYFVGHCCIRFISVYRQWNAEEGNTDRVRQLERDFSLDPATGISRHPAPAPEAAMVRASEFEFLANTISNPTTRNIFMLKAEGYADVEIAEALELSLATVKSRVYAFRQTLRKAASDHS